MDHEDHCQDRTRFTLNASSGQVGLFSLVVIGDYLHDECELRAHLFGVLNAKILCTFQLIHCFDYSIDSMPTVGRNRTATLDAY